MDSMGVMIGVISLVCGLYCFYAIYDMKQTGEINKRVLLSKDMENQQCKDKKAYIAEALPKVFIIGTVAVVYGGMEMINAFVFNLGSIIFIGLGVFILVLVWVAVQLTKMRKKYF